MPTACAYWDLDEDRNQIKEKWGENADYYPYKVLGKGISADETTYNGRSTLGWDAIAVTDHCKNMDAVLKVIDFLASEEGQYRCSGGLKWRRLELCGWQTDTGCGNIGRGTQ